MKVILSKLGIGLAIVAQLLLLPGKSFGQVPGDYVLSSQAEVDAFDATLLEVGDLVISGADITNIARLSNLTQVGELTIENNPLLTSLAPLNNIVKLTSPLRIAGNPTLGGIDGFSSLTNAYNITITNNITLTSVSGFNALATLYGGYDGGIYVDGNPGLLTISGFNALPNAGNVTIAGNTKLTDITGFHLLTSVRTNTSITRYAFGYLTITNNPELVNFDGLLALKALDNLKLSGNSKLKNVHGFLNLTAVYAPIFTISGNATLEDLDGLSNLTTSFSDYRVVGSSIVSLDHNPMLTKPCGIYKFLNQLNYIVDSDGVHIEGSGFHMYQLIECGITRIKIPPAPIIALDFNQGTAIAPVNSGVSGASFTRSAGTPLSSVNVPANVGGTNSFDFGTTPGNYYVESSAPVDALKNLNAFTLTGWLNCKSSTAGGGGNRVISWINGGQDGVDLVYQSNGSLRLGVDGWPDNSPAFSSAGKIPTSASGAATNWIFFAVTYQSNGQVQFYFGNTTTDATLDVTRSYTSPGVTGGTIGKLAIGSFNDVTRNSDTYNRMFRGLIDDVQIYNGSLSIEKILGIQHAVGTIVLPTRPNLMLASKTSTSVTLQWAPSSGASGYEIFRNGELSNSTITSEPSGTLTAVIPNLTPATAYSFVVRAIKPPAILSNQPQNTYVESNAVSVTTDPAVVTALHIEAESFSGSNGIANQGTTVGSTDAGDWIRFDNVNLSSGYTTITTRYAKGNNINGTATVRLGNPTTGTLIGTLTTTYTGGWGIFATTSAPLTGTSGVNTIYVSWPSSEGNGNFDWFEFSGAGSTADVTPPTTPANLALVSKTTTSASLSWTAATDNIGVTQYEVFQNVSQLAGTSTTPAITINNLTANTTYNFIVRARDAAGNYSAFSSSLTVTTNAVALATLHLEAESFNGSNGITRLTTTVESTDAGDWIRFDNINLGTGYASLTARYAKGINVTSPTTVRLDNLTGPVIGTLTTSNTGGWGTFANSVATLSGASGVHSIYVMWTTGQGNGNFDWFEFSGQSPSGRSDMSIASTSPVVEDEEEISNELYQNYPNPFSGDSEIGVSLKQSVRVAKIMVTDLSGRSLKNIEVVERGKTTVKINSGDMKSGIYVYSLIIDGQTTHIKRLAVFE